MYSALARLLLDATGWRLGGSEGGGGCGGGGVNKIPAPLRPWLQLTPHSSWTVPRCDPTAENANLGRAVYEDLQVATSAEREPLKRVRESVFYDINLSLPPSLAPHNGREPSVEAIDPVAVPKWNVMWF